jgi:hypothetical protein
MALRVLLRDILLFCVVGNEDYHAWWCLFCVVLKWRESAACIDILFCVVLKRGVPFEWHFILSVWVILMRFRDLCCFYHENNCSGDICGVSLEWA